jgi:Zn-dependent M28 family amino/carboxypeptidase
VVLLFPSGEEPGLWGSTFFVGHATWRVDEIVAAINLDMIGRTGVGAERVDVHVTPSCGHERYTTLAQQAARCAEQLGLRVLDGDRVFDRSDHFAFACAGVPVVSFGDGNHEDYHCVTDVADRLDGEKMERVARAAFLVARAAAESDARPRASGPLGARR